jgi:hypothetical protein
MISEFKRFYERGLLVSDPDNLHLSVIDRYCTVELTEPGFTPVYHEGEPLTVPRRVDHDNSDTHNILDESVKFLVSGAKKLKDADCFWTDLKRFIVESGAPTDLLHRVEALQAKCQGLRCVKAYKQANSGIYYWAVPESAPDPAPYPFRGKLSAETIQRTGVIHDGVTIIFMYHGVPIHQIPEIQAHWKAQFFVSKEPNSIIATDAITGEKGVAVRLLPQAKIGGYRAPLASFNSDAWAFNRSPQATSLPLTLKTALILNAGFESLLDKQTMRLDKLGVDDTAVSWHVVGTLEHPILSILSAVFNGGDVDETKAAWAELRKLPDDNSIVHFVAWASSRGRFGLLDDWSVSVTKLRDSLLQYDAEWSSFPHHPVRRMLLRKKQDTLPYTLPSIHHVPVFRAITLGTQLSDAIASDQINNGVHRDERGSTQWILVGLSRKHGNFMAKPVIDIILTEYNSKSKTPRLSEYVGDLELRLADQPSDLAAFQFGQLLCMHNKIGINYRAIKGHRFEGTPIMQRVRSLKEYFAKEVRQVAFWRGLLAERGGPKTRLAALYYDDLIRRLDPMMQINTANVYVAAGWSRAYAYLDEVGRWYTMVEADYEPGDGAANHLNQTIEAELNQTIEPQQESPASN